MKERKYELSLDEAISILQSTKEAVAHRTFKDGEFYVYSQERGTVIDERSRYVNPCTLMDESMQTGWSVVENTKDHTGWFTTKKEDAEVFEEESECEQQRRRDANIGGYSFSQINVTVFANGSKVYYVKPENKGVGEGTVVGARFAKMMDGVDILEYRIRFSSTQCEKWFHSENVYASKLDLMAGLFPN
jgi:hypothetical protein